MARIEVTKKKKSPRVAELSQLKEKLRRTTEQLESRERELAEATEQQTATSEILRVIALTHRLAVGAGRGSGECRATVWLVRCSRPSCRW